MIFLLITTFTQKTYTVLKVFFFLIENQGGSITVESLQALFTQRERETFSDAVCLCGSRTYRMKGSFARVSPEEFGFVRPEQRLPFTL